MPRFCASCGAQMADAASVCPACGKAAGQSAGGGTATAPAPVAASSGSGIDPKLGGLLCYLPVGPIPLIADIFFLVAEPYKNDKFLRFHAFQSLFLGVGLFALMIGAMVLGAIMAAVFPPLALLMLLVWPLVGLSALVLCIICMIKAYGGQMWRIPIIGNFAAKQAGV
jgi:uncharacterized membrane protein